MASVGDEESKSERWSQSNARHNATSWQQILFLGHNFTSRAYFDIGKIDIECVQCGALHFNDKKSQKFSAILSKILYQFPAWKFYVTLLSRVLSILRELLTRSDTVSRQFCQKMRLYNAVCSTVSMTANWVSRALDKSVRNPTMTVKGKVYHNLGALISPQKIKHSCASVYVYNSNEIERATIKGSNVGQQLIQDILIDLGTVITHSNTYAQTF